MSNRRTLLLVVALMIAGSLVSPSTAAPQDIQSEDTLGSGVELSPTSEYATVEDDELVVDLSATNPALDGAGVNRNARTTLSDVFRLGYSGSTYAHVWITHDSDDVTFSVGGQPIGSEANKITLAPDESVPVALTVDVTGGEVDESIDEITFHARVAEPETTTTASVETVRSVVKSDGSRAFTALATTEGDVVQFDANRMVLDRAGTETLTFDGLSAGTTGGPLRLTVDAVGTETERAVVRSGAEPLGGIRVTVENGGVSNATLQFSASEAYFATSGVDPTNLTVYRKSDGELSEEQVRVVGHQNGRVSFVAETPGFSTFVLAVDRPRLTVTDVSLDAETIAPGEPVTVSTVVSNEGSLAGQRQIAVSVDGRLVAERTVTVSPGEAETVTVTVTSNVTGEHVVAVDGTEQETFVVEPSGSEPATPEGTPAAVADDGTSTQETAAPDSATAAPVEEPGSFGLANLLGLIGFLALVAALLALGRRVPRG